MYTYDSFLFDLDNKEEELVEEVLKIFKKYKLQVKLNYGTSYNFEWHRQYLYGKLWFW